MVSGDFKNPLVNTIDTISTTNIYREILLRTLTKKERGQKRGEPKESISSSSPSHLFHNHNDFIYYPKVNFMNIEFEYYVCETEAD